MPLSATFAVLVPSYVAQSNVLASWHLSVEMGIAPSVICSFQTVQVLGKRVPRVIWVHRQALELCIRSYGQSAEYWLTSTNMTLP